MNIVVTDGPVSLQASSGQERKKTRIAIPVTPMAIKATKKKTAGDNFRKAGMASGAPTWGSEVLVEISHLPKTWTAEVTTENQNVA